MARKEVQDAIETSVSHFVSKGYLESEISAVVEFDPRFHNDDYISESYKLRIYAYTPNVDGQTLYIDYSYHYTDRDYTKDRNEEGLKVKAIIEQHFAEMKHIEEQKKAAEQQNKDAEKLAEAQAKENMRQWALQNGTELLKLRIEENMNWYDLANTEYFASIMPDEFIELDEPDDTWEIKNATVEQIKALREVKKYYPSARLMRYKYDLQTEDNADYYYENDEDRYEHKDVIQINLKSISGEEKYFEKEL